MGAGDVIQVRARRPGDEDGWVRAQLRKMSGRNYPPRGPVSNSASFLALC